MSIAGKIGKQLLLAALLILSLGCFAPTASAASVSTEVRTLSRGDTDSVKGYYNVKSSRSSVVSVKQKASRNYTISGLRKGRATLSCYNKNGTLKKTIYVLVTNDKSFVYDTTPIYLAKGKTKKVRASTNFDSSVTIKYASSNNQVATVSSSGRITAVKAGTATIKAKFYYRGTKVKTRKKTVCVFSSSYDNSALSLAEGSTAKVAASVSGNCSVNYTSTDPSVAKVNSHGKITAKKQGTATIRCRVLVGDTVVKRYSKDVTVISSSLGEQIAAYALQFVGNPYVWGGEDLVNGSDCSGFTMKVFEHFGIYLPHFADYQMKSMYTSVQGTSIPLNTASLKAGDLIFYGSSSYADHVMLYIGNGQVVGARGSKYGVTVEAYNYMTPVKAMRYWS